tara:strand:- start:237 stop:893 length:657 start_codon:yes stop_codon:yes gene_type:complete
MTTIVIVERTGNVKHVKVKNVSRDTLYSKCGFKKSDGFERRTVWKVTEGESYTVELWSREHGNANTENKYDFPPPVDNELYFGNCCVVRIDEESDDIVSLTMGEWKKIYENLFGGFEDLVEEEPSEDELDNVSEDMKTHSGYLKDGFVVGTDSDIETSCSEDGDDINEIIDDDESKVEVKNAEINCESDEESCESGESGESESGSELETETFYFSDDE